MRIRYTETARAEATEIFEHIARDNPAAAATVAAAINGAIARLAVFPRIGAATNDPSVFIKIARPYHHLIFYSSERDTVMIPPRSPSGSATVVKRGSVARLSPRSV
jgi:plasmid stabilization system protein ParE